MTELRPTRSTVKDCCSTAAAFSRRPARIAASETGGSPGRTRSRIPRTEVLTSSTGDIGGLTMMSFSSNLALSTTVSAISLDFKISTALAMRLSTIWAAGTGDSSSA
ncbi:hypothetical protein D3C72_1457390 [compost metagenome]